MTKCVACGKDLDELQVYYREDDLDEDEPYCESCALAQRESHAQSEREEREREQDRARALKLEQAKNMEISGRYEEAARIYDEFEMYEKAGECRRMARTSYQISTNFTMGKDGISCSCPICGSSQAVESKSNLVTCRHCGNNYIIPKKVIDMM